MGLPAKVMQGLSEHTDKMPSETAQHRDDQSSKEWVMSQSEIQEIKSSTESKAIEVTNAKTILELEGKDAFKDPTTETP